MEGVAGGWSCAFERDRRAILAMAGTYRVTFDFLEVAPFTAQDKPNAPYQSWGTEKIYVDADDGKSISLVHILEMRVVQKDGSISEPMVTKHWRQDWRYEPAHIVEYQGRDRWQRRKLDARGGEGAWSQSRVSGRRVAALCEHRSLAAHAELLDLAERRHAGVRCRVANGACAMTIRCWSARTATPSSSDRLDSGRKQSEGGADRSARRSMRRGRISRASTVLRATSAFAIADFAAADRYYERTKQFWDEVRDRWSAMCSRSRARSR